MRRPDFSHLSRYAALPLAPVLLVQARYLRRVIPRLPDAELPWTGTVRGAQPIRLLVLGDSTAAGVGAVKQEDALPGNLARELRHRFSRGVTWRAVGENGGTTRDLLERYMGEALEEPADIVFLTIGANDALGLRSRGAFRRDLLEVVRQLREANPDAPILVSLMPRFDRFASLVNPLRWNLALHASSLDTGGRTILEGLSGVFVIPKPPPYPATFWASDGFHPSESGYREWIDFAIETVPGELLDRLKK